MQGKTPIEKLDGIFNAFKIKEIVHTGHSNNFFNMTK